MAIVEHFYKENKDNWFLARLRNHKYRSYIALTGYDRERDCINVFSYYPNTGKTYNVRPIKRENIDALGSALVDMNEELKENLSLILAKELLTK